jgi:hypothetical protein
MHSARTAPSSDSPKVTATHIDRLARGTFDLSGIVARTVDAKA